MLTQFKTSILAAHTAAASGDYQAALSHARAARIALVGIPKSEFDREKIEYNVEDLDALIKDLTQAANAQRQTSLGSAWQAQDILYTRH
jgi:hypothetical protein